MNVSSVIDRLNGVAHSYHWDVDNKRVVATLKSGTHRGHTLNPVTALAHKAGLGVFDNTRDGTEYAASLLGIPRTTARAIYSATLGTHNRGNTQVLRGKIRSALEV
tara:strand:+ start:1064 stop:1381 length:318 start_codon:yes stop_codon:yes gene_type:complete